MNAPMWEPGTLIRWQGELYVYISNGKNGGLYAWDNVNDYRDVIGGRPDDAETVFEPVEVRDV